MVRFSCPACQRVLSGVELQAGARVTCPGCRQPLQLPSPAAGASAAGNWYTSRHGQMHGPFPWAELCRRVAAGELLPTDVVCAAGQTQWQSATAVPGLTFPSPPAAPAPPAAVRPAVPVRERPPAQETFFVRGGLAALPRPRSRRRLWALLGTTTAAAALAVLLVVHFRHRSQTSPVQPDQVAEGEKPPEHPAEGGKEEKAEKPPGDKPDNSEKDGKGSGTLKPKQPKPPPEPPRVLTTEELVARSEKSVALIRSGPASGTGFLLAPGILATNAHVLRLGALEQIKVCFPSAPNGKDLVRVRSLLHLDLKRDLAFLEVEADWPPLPLAGAYEFRRGQDVVVIGNPGFGDGQVLENAVSRGVMSSQLEIRGHFYYQLGIAVNPGNSGGPVFDQRGQVIGMVTLKARQQEGVGFCIPAKDLQAGLDLAEAQTPQGKARLAARHDAQVVFRRLATANRVCTEALKMYVEGAREAEANGMSVADGIRAAADKVLPQVNEINRKLISDLDPILRRVVADEDLPESVRTDLADLERLYRDQKGSLRMPPANLRVLVSRVDSLSKRLTALLRSLTGELGLEDSD
jgi:S1-C subfamily serine protease